jgi:hypothetical protein
VDPSKVLLLLCGSAHLKICDAFLTCMSDGIGLYLVRYLWVVSVHVVCWTVLVIASVCVYLVASSAVVVPISPIGFCLMANLSDACLGAAISSNDLWCCCDCDLHLCKYNLLGSRQCVEQN